jgi:hypothetical protein
MDEHRTLRSLAKEMRMSEEAVMFHRTKRLTENLNLLIKSTHAAITVASGRPGPKASANIHLLSYLSVQLQRGLRWLKDDLDLLAGVVRSVSELAIWAKFVNESDENANRFLQEHAVDMKELMGYSSAAVRAPQTETLPFIEEYLASLPKRVALKRSTEIDDYVFKLCSKYVHPSAWLLTNLGKIRGFTMDRITLRLYLVTYAAKVITETQLVTDSDHLLNFTVQPAGQ